jgi:hypothetical protein
MAIRDLLPIVSVIVMVCGAWFGLKFAVSKSQGDIKGLSIREASNTKAERRKFIYRIASDIEAAAPGNSEIERLAKLLRMDAD